MEIQNPFQIYWDKANYQNFTDFFFSKIASHGSNLAMVDVDTGKQWRYSEIRGWCDMCAARLKEIQVTAGSRVAVITGTTGQSIFLHLACALIGCSAVVVNGYNTVDEIWQLVDLSEATHLIVEAQFMQKADDVRRKAQMRTGGRIKQVRLIDDVLSSESILTEKKRPPFKKEQSSAALPLSIVDDEKGSPISEDSAIKIESNDENNEPSSTESNVLSTEPSGPGAAGSNAMLIFFTSGTTGLPKASELAHKSLIINIQQMSLPLYGPVQPKEKFLLPLAISHIYGAMSAYYALVNGAVVYMLSKITPKSVADGLTNVQVNVAHVTPSMIHWFATDPLFKEISVPQLRSVLVGGAPIDSNRLLEAKERLKVKDLRQTYGMTEMGGLCTLPAYETDVLESVGHPLPGMLMKIVNWENKTICPPRKPGQLLVMGPQVLPSYFKNQKATSELLDSNGYVRTGDAAFYDESGRIYILDRIKDIIKYKGTLVCPSEVELILRAHPGIDDCAVVGRQDHVSGEVPAAFVVKNPGHPLLASAEVRQYVSGKIATFKELRGGVFFIPEIPRSTCGKIIRRQLRQFWDRERTNAKAETAAAARDGNKATKPNGVQKTGTPASSAPISRSSSVANGRAGASPLNKPPLKKK